MMKKVLLTISLGMGLINSSCSLSGSIGPEPESNTPQCSRLIVSGLAILDDQNNILAANYSLTSPLTCKTFKAVEIDDCGDITSPVTPDSWAVSSSLGYLQSQQNDEAVICFNQGASEGAIQIAKAPMNLSVQTQVSWVPTSISGLFRWYKADSFLPLPDQTKIGQSALYPWSDFSGLTPNYNSTSATGREPTFTTSAFLNPAIKLCGNGASSGCSGVTSTQHLRVASSYNELAASDLTVIFVAARNNANANFLFANQSSGNNTGTFLGWVNGTSLRFGLNGPSATTAVTATVPSYTTPKFEIIMGRLNTGSDSSNPGLRLYLNNSEIASNASINVQQAAATTIPYINSHRSENANSQVHIGEVIIFKRAISVSESCALHQYLSAKYQINLSAACVL